MSLLAVIKCRLCALVPSLNPGLVLENSFVNFSNSRTSQHFTPLVALRLGLYSMIFCGPCSGNGGPIVTPMVIVTASTATSKYSPGVWALSGNLQLGTHLRFRISPSSRHDGIPSALQAMTTTRAPYCGKVVQSLGLLAARHQCSSELKNKMTFHKQFAKF